jgi:hypothetical protein
VLGGLSFNVYKPKVLIIENLFLEQGYVDYFVQKGYALWKRLEPNDVFVRQDLLDIRKEPRDSGLHASAQASLAKADASSV